MATEAKTVFCFGASMVCGLGSEGQGWARSLETEFYHQNPDVAANPRDVPLFYTLGVLANRAVDVAARMEGEMTDRLRRRRGAVATVLSVGHSDALLLRNGQPRFPIDEMLSGLATIAAIVRKFNSSLLYVGLSPCDDERARNYLNAPFGYSNEHLKTVEDAACQAVESGGGVTVPLMDTLLAEGFQRTSVSGDGLHPNRAGYGRIAELVMKPFLDLVGAPRRDY